MLTRLVPVCVAVDIVTLRARHVQTRAESLNRSFEQSMFVLGRQVLIWVAGCRSTEKRERETAVTYWLSRYWVEMNVWGLVQCETKGFEG